MSEYSEVLWCEKCQCRQSFLMSGSGLIGTCLTCGYKIYGKRIFNARLEAVKDFKEKKLFDFIFKDNIKLLKEKK